ncbi:MAG TPA: copper resistance protein CopC, partial [Streptosporangiaceae bacterium]
MARRFAHLVATLFFTGFVLLAGATAASAHATVVSTSPADGSVVKHAPAQVTVTYDEPVGISPDSLKVFAPNGEQVGTGGAKHGKVPAEVVLALKSGLANGTYTVGWAVVSADSHHVSGAFTFSIGAPSATKVNPNTVNQATSALVSYVFGVVRWLAFACFGLLIGAVGFVLWCWPAGASSPLVLRLTMGAWSGLAGSVLGAVLLQGVYGAGEGVNQVFWPNVLHQTLDSRYGRSLGIRLILVIVALFVFTAILGNLQADSRRAPVAASVTWGGLAVALAATWAFADHAGTGSQVPLSLVSDTVHLSAGAIWLGGLTMLATIVLRRPRPPAPRQARGKVNRKTQPAPVEAVQAVERFSPVALGCVGAILLTGTYQAWRNVGTWGALFATTYGRLLLIKIAAMCVLIGLGYLARIRITAMRAPASAARVSLVEFVTAGLPRVAVGVRSGLRLPGT